MRQIKDEAELQKRHERIGEFVDALGNGIGVRTLEGGTLPAGAHAATWDGTNNQGEAVTSGVYFYRLDAGDFRSTKKMVLLR